jgi:hypothetical protein
VCEDLISEEDNEKTAFYATFSASTFKQFLQDEYHRLDQIHKEKVEAESEENKKRARTLFDALGEEMGRAATREELIELGRKRADLAPLTGTHYNYQSHCWNCKKPISSAIHAKCPNCKYYICGSCRSCFC